ncbi:unnamed protein product [Soboliphyme baturini]|uniref:BACK domain-containing protein n=1 Tax=Soboliphyme baturini TaxID=241478 RepID=A0A183IZ96_9BILA|nr:unnamed protein product [Soboliphyme baturini]
MSSTFSSATHTSDVYAAIRRLVDLSALYRSEEAMKRRKRRECGDNFSELNVLTTVDNSTDMSVVAKPGTNTFRHIITYFHCGQVQVGLQEVPELFFVAKSLGVTSLVKYLEQYLLNEAAANPENLGICCSITYLCEASDQVKKDLLYKIGNSFYDESVQEQIELLPAVVICDLLSLEYIRLDPNQSEAKVLDTVLRWMAVNRANAEDLFPSVLNSVRLELLSTEEKFQALDKARSTGLLNELLPKLAAAEWRKLCTDRSRTKYGDVDFAKIMKSTNSNEEITAGSTDHEIGLPTTAQGPHQLSLGSILNGCSCHQDGFFQEPSATDWSLVTTCPQICSSRVNSNKEVGSMVVAIMETVNGRCPWSQLEETVGMKISDTARRRICEIVRQIPFKKGTKGALSR